MPTWIYQFDYDQPPFLVPWVDLGAFHAAEIQYVFGRPMTFTGGTFDAAESALASSMMGNWVQFARTGNPNGDNRLFWPPYDRSDQTLRFNLQNSVDGGVHEKKCRFWDELDYLRPVYRQSPPRTPAITSGAVGVAAVR